MHMNNGFKKREKVVNWEKFLGYIERIHGLSWPAIQVVSYVRFTRRRIRQQEGVKSLYLLLKEMWLGHQLARCGHSSGLHSCSQRRRSHRGYSIREIVMLRLGRRGLVVQTTELVLFVFFAVAAEFAVWPCLVCATMSNYVRLARGFK